MNMTQILRDNENEIRQFRMNGMKMRELAIKYGVTYSIMTHFLTTHSIIPNKKPIKDDIIKNIVQRYKNGERYDYIAKDVHMDKEAVRFIIEQNGYAIKEKSDAFQKYHINQYYFDEINTPEKAYFLGLLYTDGCRNKREDHYQIVLKLQDRDVDILYQFQEWLEYNRPLKYVQESLHHPNSRNQYALIIDNKQIATSLEKWGIIPNKTAFITFPDFLPEEFYPHFIRGCWEGDGTISHNPKNHKTSIVGTEALLTRIQEIAKEKVNVNFQFRKHICQMENICVLGTSGRHQMKRFLDYIYQDSTVHFHRKYSYYRFMCYGEPLINSLSIVAH